MAALDDAAAAGRPAGATIDLALVAPAYHEKQSLMRCAVHSLNNLFQRRLYDASSLDGLCQQLSPDAWLNPHRSVLGLGNYDINVLIVSRLPSMHAQPPLALEAAGYNLHWHDRRQPLKRVSSPPLLGFIVNQTTPRLFSLYRSQHWYPCRAFDDGRAWFELNSVKPRAVAIPDVVAYCEALLLDPHTQLLWIVQRGVKREEVYAERGVGTFTPPPASNDAAG